MNVSLPCPLSVCVPCKFITTPHTPPSAKKKKFEPTAGSCGSCRGDQTAKAREGRRGEEGGGKAEPVYGAGEEGEEGEGEAHQNREQGKRALRCCCCHARGTGKRGRSTDPPSPPAAVSWCIQVTWGKMKERSFRFHSSQDKLLLASENSVTLGRKGLLFSIWKKTSCFFVNEMFGKKSRQVHPKLTKIFICWVIPSPPPPRSLFPLDVSQQEVECALHTEQIIHKVVILIPSLSY